MKVTIIFYLGLMYLISLGNSKVRKSDIDLYFYSKSNPLLGNSIDISHPSELNQVKFLSNRDTIFLIHGYMERPKYFESSSQALKNIILSKYDVNIFVVDYSKISTNFYPIAVQEVEAVGQTLATIIKDIVKHNGLDLDKTKIIGTSLGAHVAGVTGTALGGKIDQMIGIDPAGPLFNLERTSNRLSKSSANFTHVIHTCGGGMGMLEPLGHADYYVNGGRRQPICGPDHIGACSHILSVTYYSESLLTGNFKAKKCSNYEKFKKGKCKNGEDSRMGEYNVDKKANGLYFLDTNMKRPYAKG